MERAILISYANKGSRKKKNPRKEIISEHPNQVLFRFHA